MAQYLVASKNHTNDTDPGGGGDKVNPIDLLTSRRDLQTQATISVVLGLAAFLGFCFLRTRWPSLYAARRKQKNEAKKLPVLPDTFFGWMRVLYKVTEEDVLASAGLDAFVFLRFFKMAIKFLVFVLFFTLTVTYPIHETLGKKADEAQDHNSRGPEDTQFSVMGRNSTKDRDQTAYWEFSNDYLWIYVVFVYLYTLVALYLIVTETKKVIRVRQTYLGVQSSITDRTIRLSGIPPHLRSEAKIKETIEDLEIGKVESVTLCKNWKELDDLIDERASVLRKLEEAWTVHLGLEAGKLASLARRSQGTTEVNGSDEDNALLDYVENGRPHVSPVNRTRPSTRIWFGFLSLQSRKIDAIDYYEEKLRKLDDRIAAARKKEYLATPLAFVTLDSIAACQMAIQAILDPEAMQLVANPSPAPADVVWRNTYLPRRNRMIRAWSITFIILLLTLVWFSVLIPFGALLNLEAIKKFVPPLAEFLEEHEVLQALVRTGLPTLAMSILNALVPYLYDWLSNLQGMTSQGDVEMSVISKNFFFTFFTLFVAFTLIGTASNAYALGSLGDQFGRRFNDLAGTAHDLASSLEALGSLYMNLVVFQALGIFPLRLLEFGSVFMYPIGLIGAKTPRDHAELVQPPIFSYGFSLPQTIFIFDVCIIYSILPNSELLILFGLVYFLMGSFIYKYQLLYAMDHRNFSTGRAWPMICDRILVGLIFFQIAMGGQLLLKAAIKRSVLVIPLLVATAWFSVFYRRTYAPLTKFIALRSLRETHEEAMSVGGSRYEEAAHRSRDVSRDASRDREVEEVNARFINPSLVVSLEDVWVSKARHGSTSEAVNGGDL